MFKSITPFNSSKHEGCLEWLDASYTVCLQIGDGIHIEALAKSAGPVRTCLMGMPDDQT